MAPLALRERSAVFRVPGAATGREAPGDLAAVSAQAHRNGARVDVWVVDQPEDIERLFDLGVDGVITDRPDLAVPAGMRGRPVSLAPGILMPLM